MAIPEIVTDPSVLRALALDPTPKKLKVAIVGDAVYISTDRDVAGHKELLQTMQKDGVPGVVARPDSRIAPVGIDSSLPPDQIDGFDLFVEEGEMLATGSSAYLHLLRRKPTNEGRDRSIALLNAAVNPLDSEGASPTPKIPIRRGSLS